MGRDEVLQHAQPLLEVREDGVFDNLRGIGRRFLGFGHQTTHPGELTNLLFRTTGSGVQHHVDGVEALVVFGELFEHRLSQFGVGMCPDVDNLVVAFVVGDETHVVVFHHFGDLVVTVLYERLLLFRDNHGVEVERQPPAEGHLVPHGFDIVEEVGRHCRTAFFHHVADDVAQ